MVVVLAQSSEWVCASATSCEKNREVLRVIINTFMAEDVFSRSLAKNCTYYSLPINDFEAI